MFKYLVLLGFFLVYLYKSKRSLHMLQQNLYNENNRYLKYVFHNYKDYFDLDLIFLGISIVACYVFYDIQIISNICMLVIFGLSLVLAFNWKNRLNSFQNKKPLVFTKRIKRLVFTSSLLYLIPSVILVISRDIQLTWLMIFVLSLMTLINNLVIFLANIINYPYERGVYYHYKHMAQRKLKSMTNLKVIGITGSYGKTSSKNILGDILNVKYNALPTPRNLNTPNGLIMTINNKLDKFTNIFIAEMGAYVRGEIDELCKLVHPKYGILTTIGTAHLETFGSEENIQNAKFELIEDLPEDGFAVLNMDDPKQVSYKLKNKIKTIWIAINNKDADIRATNIRCSNKGTSFDVIFKDDDNKYSFTTRLLGDHNVYNILAGIACGREFGIDMDDLIHAVRGVRAVEHRLELKKINDFYMIDDAYNSNPVGAKNACKVLGLMPGKRVVVTPGMIELGDKEYEYNRIFGTQIAEVADYVLLIGENKTKPIYDGLIEKGFDKEKIVVFNDVRDAYPFISSLSGKEDVYALFENDLPDTYNE